MNRVTVTLSIPEEFLDKFAHLVNNVNILNTGSAYIEILSVEKDDDEPEYVAIPKD